SGLRGDRRGRLPRSGGHSHREVALPVHGRSVRVGHDATGDWMNGKDSRGSVTVLAAGVLFLACSLSLASVDLLRGLQAKARVQAAADAAALAAARELAIPSSQSPTQAARDYAQR